jgi:hypothetical protein
MAFDFRLCPLPVIGDFHGLNSINVSQFCFILIRQEAAPNE